MRNHSRDHCVVPDCRECAKNEQTIYRLYVVFVCIAAPIVIAAGIKLLFFPPHP